MTPIKLVILDRDGTINRNSAEYIKSLEEWIPLPGAFEAIAALNHAGWHVVLASNQSGLGRGLSEVSDLNAIHTRMNQQLAAVGARIDAIFFCPHTPDEDCHCRKPRSGLFEQIAERFGTSLSGVPVVGDSARDLVAGANVGCEPHLVCSGNTVVEDGAPLPAEFPPNTMVHPDLGAFAQYWIDRHQAKDRCTHTS
ncbi:D-glycero-beta-D-manno-heptose 1,7-bisphosphate 7-phosphatase [Candidatus Symbiobacter mobilis]|uniref:D-glycero-beta-D-manno-heptose-1,7-bisphosphate 7-phosphatase n=1 Tax=Candidatus Symbiobacter mobilis CR TaxID=946483 RepID=U5N4V2_9BURK|nr:D-glycero-beta-D-manno-heptose 1,7-bisphosphate 7-phosphatase [Candidatus Symbiobacter mobilis]AGX86531.1 D-glycero-D-manno-heptose 1,7-bisphosphate phosphatase [Candidatus Symbiobacter mobilis CR]